MCRPFRGARDVILEVTELVGHVSTYRLQCIDFAFLKAVPH
jgi:hypothetical protein